MLLLPLGAALVWLLRRQLRRSDGWRALCDAHLLPHLIVDPGGARAPLALWLFALAWLVGVVALAGPSWERLEQPLYRSGAARVVVLDLSRSMEAADVKPSRLVRARLKVADMLSHGADAQTGLVAYAGDAFVVAPLTDDAETLRHLLPALTPQVMPAAGSRTDLALERAGELLHRAGVSRGEVILVADAVAAGTAGAAQALRAHGHRVSVLAVGTEQGAPVPLAAGGFLEDAAGNIVVSALDTAALRAVAQAGGGYYAGLTPDDSDLRQLLDAGALADATAGARPTARRSVGWRDGGPWLVLLLLPLAALAFRRGWLLCALVAVLLSPPPSHAFDWEDLWWRADQRASRALRAGDAEAALEAGAPRWEGVASYRTGQYAQAAAAFARSDGPVADYNRGNALARQGELAAALAAYDAALEQLPDFDDARHNRALVERALQQRRDAPAAPPQQAPGRPGGGDTPAGMPPPAPGDGGADSNAGEPRNEPVDAGSSRAEGGAATTAPRSAADAGQPRARTPEPAAGDAGAADEGLAAAQTGAHSGAELGQAMEQWLQRIPDDPGGLLRRKFQRQHERRGRPVSNGEPPW